MISLKSVANGDMDLYEGSYASFVIKSDKAAVEPIVTIIIPKISQVYSTNFLYMTCERRIETEVKGICTGYCGSYCAGKVCLGTRIWKWQNCRKVWCNPTWCWSTNDGCCCCGANVYCDEDAKVGALWDVQYQKTEFLLCVRQNVSDHQRHSKLCLSKPKIMAMAKEDINWEKHAFYQLHNPYKGVYIGKSKWFWITEYLIIFIISFTPSVTADRHNHCISKHVLRSYKSCIDTITSLKNLDSNMFSNTMLSDQPQRIAAVDNSHLHQSEWINNFNPGNPDSINKAEENLLLATSSIVDNIKKLQEDFKEFFADQTKYIMKTVNSAKELISGEINSVLKDVIEEETCQKWMVQIHAFKDLSDIINIPSPQTVRIHKDDYIILTQFVDNIVENMGHDQVQSKFQPAVSAGQDSLVQKGRNTQQVQGESGGSNKFGLGASHNTDLLAGDGDITKLLQDRILDESEQDDSYKPPPLVPYKPPVHQPGYLSSDTRQSPRISFKDRLASVLSRSKRSSSEDLNHELKQTDAKAEIEKEVLAMESYRPPNQFDFVVDKDKSTAIYGKNVKIDHHQISNKRPVLSLTKGTPHQTTNKEWYKFKNSIDVCEVNCLHEPDTCDCLDTSIPKSGKFDLPWTLRIDQQP